MAHVVLGDFDTASLSRTAFLPALSGESIEVKSVSGSIFIGGAHVLRPDLRVINGVIHIVDSAVQPFRPAESAAPTFAPTTSCDWSCQALQVDPPNSLVMPFRSSSHAVQSALSGNRFGAFGLFLTVPPVRWIGRQPRVRAGAGDHGDRQHFAVRLQLPLPICVCGRPAVTTSTSGGSGFGDRLGYF
jgi:hypothetical protein